MTYRKDVDGLVDDLLKQTGEPPAGVVRYRGRVIAQGEDMALMHWVYPECPPSDYVLAKALRHRHKDPKELMQVVLARNNHSPESFDRLVGNLHTTVSGFNLEPPRKPLNTLHKAFDATESADINHRGEDLKAAETMRGYVSLLAEEGSLDTYFQGSDPTVRRWVAEAAHALRSVITQSPHFRKEDGKSLAKIMLAVSMTLIRLDDVLQTSYVGRGDLQHHRYSLIGMGLQDIRYAIVIRVLQELAAESKGQNIFELLQVFKDEMDRCTKNINGFHSERIPETDLFLRQFRTVLDQRPAGALQGLREAHDNLERMVYLPPLAKALQKTPLFQEDLDPSSIERFPAHGYVALIEMVNDFFVHYALDGTRGGRSHVTVRADGVPLREGFQPLFPDSAPSYILGATREGAKGGYLGYSVIGDHIFVTDAGVFTPPPILANYPKIQEVLLKVEALLHGHLHELKKKYPNFFLRLHEFGPAIFMLLPGNEDILYCHVQSGGLHFQEAAALIGTTRYIAPEHLHSFPNRLGFTLGAGRWCALCLPTYKRAEERGRAKSEEPPQHTIDAPTLERAKLRSALRGYQEPTLEDLLRILRHTEGVMNVTHEAKGRSHGSHGEIIVTFDDGRTAKHHTWGKIQKPNARIRWSTVFECLETFNIPSDHFFAAIESNNLLRKA